MAATQEPPRLRVVDGDALAGVREELDELYPGAWALPLIEICGPSCDCGAPGKRPHAANWTADAAARLEGGTGREAHLSRIAQHVARGGNVGLPVPPRIVVLDADTAIACAALEEQMPLAPRQVSRPGRAHFLGRLPADFPSLRAHVGAELAGGIRVDLRTSERSQIVVAPSNHADTGQPYTWRRELPSTIDDVPMLPDELLESLRAYAEAKPAPGPGAERPTGSHKIHEGEGRNDYLSRYAYKLRREGLEVAAIESCLFPLNDAVCNPPLGASEVRDIARGKRRVSPEGRVERGPELRDPAAASPQLVQLSTVATKRINWAWRGRLPLGKLTVLDGDPDKGKSTLALDVAARISMGTCMPDGSAGPGPAATVYLAAEDGIADTLRPRYEAAGGNAELLFVLDAIRDDATGRLSPPNLIDHLPQIEKAISDTSAFLLVVDPLMAFLAGKKAKDAQEMAEAFYGLRGVLERTECACLALRHLAKSGYGGKAIYRGQMSVAIVGAARSGLFVEDHPDDDSLRVLAVAKGNLARPDERVSLAYKLESKTVPAADGGPLLSVPVVRWLEGTVAWSADDLAGARDLSPKVADCAERLRELLQPGVPRPAAELEARLREERFSANTIKAARRAAGVRVAKTGFAGGWEWSR